MKTLSLRMRLTLLTALVMACAAGVLTTVFLWGADHIFVQKLQQEFVVSSSAAMPSAEIKLGSEQTQRGRTDAFMKKDSENPEIMTVQVSLERAGQKFNLWGLAGLCLVIVLGTGAAWLTAGSALKPLKELSDAIEEVGTKDFSRRVKLDGRKDEIGRLAQSFNAMMDKVSASFERQKRFSANAAHELKTPLATIQVGLDVVKLDPSPERMRKALDVTKTNTERMIRLLDSLFCLSAEQETEMSDKVQLSDILQEAAEELSPLINQKCLSVSIEYDFKDDFYCSRVMLYRAVYNLTENAAKYNNADGTLGLSASEENGFAVIKVSNTGPGIPQEAIGHIFEPFYRVDQSRSRAAGGFGLGLSIVKDIAERHGGSVEAESAPEKGTVFTMRLPLRR